MRAREGRVMTPMERGHTFYNAYARGPKVDAARYALAERLNALGKLDKANTLLRSLARKHPDFYGSHLALGRNLVRQSRWAEAEPALSRALKLKASCAEASMLLADVLRATRRPAEAARLYTALAERCPELGLAHLELGRLQRERGLLGKAYKSIRAAADVAGSRSEALLERIPLELLKGRFDAAFRDCEEILAHGLRRELFVDKLLFPFGEVARPPFTRIRLIRVRARLADYLRGQPRSAWGHCLNLSLAMMIEGEFDGAPYLRPLDRVARGRFVWMRWLMGAVHQRRMEWRPAMAQFAQVVRAYPAFMRPKFLIGDDLIGLGRPSQALSFFLLAKPMEPGQNGRWLAWMGEMHLRLGRYEEALRYLDRACASADTDSLAFTWRGAAKQRLGRLDEALRDLNEGARRNADDVEAYNWRAENMRLRGRHERALADSAQALRIFPGDICARITRALVYYDLKRHDKMRQEHGDVVHELLRQWGRVLAKAGVRTGRSPGQMRSFLTGCLGILENWLRAHDLMPEPLALRLLADGTHSRSPR